MTTLTRWSGWWGALALAAAMSSGPGCTPGGGESDGRPGGGGTPGPAPASGDAGRAVFVEDRYEYYGLGDRYTPEQKQGRDTWIMWTGGNQKFFRLGSVVGGKIGVPIEYYRLLDSRGRPTRFRRLGLINEPNFRMAAGPDKDTGLWLDQWAGDPTYPDTKVYGEPTGIVGLRKFPNPKFDPGNWDLDDYQRDPSSMEPPYLIGMSCAFCHMAFNPLNPPADPENPKWENLAANLGNQYLHEGGVFFGDGKVVFGGANGGKGLGDEDVLHHLAETQQRGTSETSRLSYDFINNPNAINSIFLLESRPAFADETFTPAARDQIAKILDPAKVGIHHVLKDGSDSQGIPIASIRVYVNIGMCGSYWIEQLWNPFKPDAPQKPFAMARADADFPEWGETLRRMPELEAYLATYKPFRLEKAKSKPGEPPYVIPAPGEGATDEQRAAWARVEHGRQVFAENCAFCHSSKGPDPATEAAAAEALATLRAFYTRTDGQAEDDAVKAARSTVQAYYRDLVARDDFLDGNVLTDDVRYPVSELKTNAARALATNATGGHIWEEFSSPEYKALPAAGTLTLYNPATGQHDRTFDPPAGGRGYYRTASLVSIWATAPFLHNNSVGKFTGDPSIRGRLDAFDDGIHKLLWPESRDGLESMKVARTRTYLNLRLSVVRGAAERALPIPDLPPPPDLPGLKLPGDLRACLDKLAEGLRDADSDPVIAFPVPKGTPINLLANINISDKEKRVKAVAHYIPYVFHSDVRDAARRVESDLKARRLPHRIATAVADEADKKARAEMDALLGLSEYPDLVEDHGHEYGAELDDADKDDLIEYLKRL
jgi:mono/diheme cytochrome c family protein